MQFNQESSPRHFTIRAYRPGEIVLRFPLQAGQETNELRQETLRVSFLLSPQVMRRDWPELRPDNLTEIHLQALLDMDPELVLLGTGEKIQFPRPETSHFFTRQGIGMDFMTTAAACRTYNILMLEGRRVAAALMW